MRYFCLMSLFLFCYLLSSCQNQHDYIWMTGTENATTIIDFNNGKTELTKIEGAFRIDFTNTSICNSNGEFQFASNGCWVVNQEIEVMLGEGKSPIIKDYICGELFVPFDPYPGKGQAQGGITLPLPGSDSLYYIFSHALDTVGTNPTIDIYNKELRYAIVDMSLDEGLGKIISKNNSFMPKDSIIGEHIVSTLHANKTDWWILQMAELESKFYTILFTENGVESVSTQKIGPIDKHDSSGGSTFSPDGKYYVQYIPEHGLFAYDFDNETGLLSNMRTVTFPDTAFAGGVAFSSNSRFLYTAAYDKIYQTDFWEEDLQEGTTLVVERDTSLGSPPFFIVNFYQAQLAPDCKIYISTSYGGSNYTVIHHPNEPAPYCDVEQVGFETDWQLGRGVPNYPHFRGLIDEVCDPTIIANVIHIDHKAKDIDVYPNPASDVLSIRLQESCLDCRIRLYDTQGKIQLVMDGVPDNFNVSQLPASMYFLQLIDEKGRLEVTKKVVVNR